MANFFTDVFDSFTGQKVTPQSNILSTQDALSQGYATATGLAPQMLAYNQALAPGLTDIQLGVQNQIYGPSANQLQRGAYQSVLDQLNLGSALPADLQEQVIRNALEGSAASGFGVGAGGRGLVAADLGLTGLQLQNQRTDRALGAVSALPSSRGYTPQGILDPQNVASDIRDVQAAQDNYANLKESIRRDNFASLLNTGGRIIGGVIGGVLTSGSPMGIEAGKGIGGSIFQGSGGYNQQQAAQGAQGSSFLTGLLGGSGSIGGPQYGVGSGRGYINPSGNFQQSVRAEQVMG